ncbi:MAG: hypothetical protein H6563_02180 [Lewinellaceae bacterium]|nr:hypothetical protein [Lewinellaceae bacterium]
MNQAHIHLLLNHFPILGSLFAAGILFFGVILNDRKVNQVGLLSLVAFTLLTIPAFLSGHGAEEVIEDYPGISHAAIHNHEEAAELGLWIMVIAGVIALVSYFLQRRKEQMHRLLSLITLVAATAAFGVFFRVGLTGGEIRHPEIIKPIAVPDNPGSDQLYNGEHEENDED